MFGLSMPDWSYDLHYMLEPQSVPQLELLPHIILVLLGLAALIDAFTGRVPHFLIVIGMGVVIFFAAVHTGWPLTGLRLLVAAIAFTLLVYANRTYMNLCHREAFGMGDAKWTAVAAATFGLTPVFWAWVLGAWFGLLWLGLRFILGLVWPGAKSSGYVHFAPFLMIGLLIKLYGFPVLFGG